VNPFTALGLPPSADVTDEQVRAAWRSIATATHPDREDGGDPARYAAAAAAYAQLRTTWQRTETLADLTTTTTYIPPAEPPARPPTAAAWHHLVMLPARIRHGRPLRIAARAIIATAVAITAVTVIPGTPAAPAIVTGCALWWALTARGDLAPPPGR
jgi:hypothetical protein